MKRNITTIEANLFDIGLCILLLIVIAILVYSVKKRNDKINTEPTITDLLQQQEMIDYAKSQGRTIRF